MNASRFSIAENVTVISVGVIYTPSSPPTNQPSSQLSSSKKKSVSNGLIIGIVIASILFLIFLIISLAYCYRVTSLSKIENCDVEFTSSNNEPQAPFITNPSRGVFPIDQGNTVHV